MDRVKLALRTILDGSKLISKFALRFLSAHDLAPVLVDTNPETKKVFIMDCFPIFFVIPDWNFDNIKIKSFGI